MQEQQQPQQREAASSSKTGAMARAELQRLLRVRAEIKSHTPDFQRQESWRYIRIHEPWRKPKGIDSHMRLSVKGWPQLVKVGYRVPRIVRGLHPSGFRDVLVHNLAELEVLTPGVDAARLSSSVGRKKKIELARRAKELGIKVLNGRGLLVIDRETAEKEGEEEEKKEKKETKTAGKKKKMKKKKNKKRASKNSK